MHIKRLHHKIKTDKLARYIPLFLAQKDCNVFSQKTSNEESYCEQKLIVYGKSNNI